MDDSEINLLLTKMDMRKINNGHCLSYKKQYYQLQDQYQTPIYLKRKTIVNVIETFNGDLYATFNDELFLLKRVNKKDIISKAFDIVANKKTIHRKVDKPPMTHPWKAKSYLSFLEKQKHINKKTQNEIDQIRFELEINS